jgi:hypothetical protein
MHDNRATRSIEKAEQADNWRAECRATNSSRGELKDDLNSEKQI